jgi:eukaryotic-like serine/threonine-protein kinase
MGPDAVVERGACIGHRFVIETRIGAGGMGVVYRARDRESMKPVAVKVAHEHGPASLQRFERESRMLSELHHPAIVSYLAHGMTDDGRLYLVMEWLDGEDLGQRLDRQALSLSEALQMVQRVAEALAVAHVNGIVHRDIKPSNLFLVGRDPARVKVLDFGAARVLDGSRPLTRTGNVLGTAGYIAPEQIRDSRHVDARADVFALGCVLYECITGQAPFVGAHPLALIAKLLVDDVPRVAQVRAEVPAEVDALVARMMAKDPAERLPNAHAVMAELADLGHVEAPAPAAVGRPAFMTGSEQRLVTAILADVRGPSHGTTLTPEQATSDRQRVVEVAEQFGGQPLALGSGSVLVLFGAGMTATDQAAHAASCAIAIAEALPEARIALATGQAATTGNMPVGPAIDAAAEVLGSAAAAGVRLDTLTAGLIDARFRVEGGTLVGAHAESHAARTLLGKPTPCVGRRKELGLLTTVLEACVEEDEAHCVLLTGDPGMGKTRLAHELSRAAEARGGTAILRARADVLGAGSSLNLARQLVADAVRGSRAEASAPNAHALREHVRSLAGLDEADRVADFLCELTGVEPGETLTPKLRAARNDARIMGEWLERSFVEWLDAWSARQPVLLVLEDIHWGDAASLAYLGRALRDLPHRPIMVLALARTEVHDKFPGLWKDLGAQEIRLAGLSRKAAEELVHSALGDRLSSADVRTIVDRAGGNAFYLEELIRCAAKGDLGDAIPDTVLAMVQSRLDALEPEARRVLCAASVFGETFPLQGVEALLGAGSTLHDAAGWLEVLERRELLGPASGRPDSPATFAFRHALVREAAYASLSEADRRTGHRLAARWLEEVGEREPKLLIEHLERGQLQEHTVPWLLQAAQRAFYAGQLAEAVALAERGLERGARDQLRGELLVCRGLARGWLQDYAGALESGEECLSLVPEGSNAWYLTAGGLIFAAALSGRPEAAASVLPRLVTAPRPDTPTGPYGFAMMLVMFGAVSMAQRELAATTVERLEQAMAGDGDDAFLGWVHQIRGMHRLWVEDHPLGAAADFRAAAMHFASAGEVTGPELAASLMALAVWHLGEVEEAERLCRKGLASFRAPAAVDNFAITLAHILLERGEHDALESTMRPRLESPDATIVGYAHMLLGDSLRRQGKLEEAEAMAREGLGITAWTLTIQPGLQRVLASTLLDAQRAEEALTCAEEGLRIAGAAGAFPIMRSELMLCQARALEALGRRPEAVSAIAKASQRLAHLSEGLSPGQRDAFLALPAHAHTVELAGRWLS